MAFFIIVIILLDQILSRVDQDSINDNRIFTLFALLYADHHGWWTKVELQPK